MAFFMKKCEINKKDGVPGRQGVSLCTPSDYGEIIPPGNKLSDLNGWFFSEKGLLLVITPACNSPERHPSV